MFIHANIEILSWESIFFKRKIVKLDFKPNAPILSLSQLNNYDITQAKISVNNIKLINAMMFMQFSMIQGEINFSLDITSILENKNSTLTIAVEEDIEELKNIATTSFLHSRFCTPWYRSVDSARLYSFWVEKAVMGTFDNVCLLIKDIKGNIHGFVTVRKSLIVKEARIGLLATINNHQRKGIGKKLVTTACQWCSWNGVEKLRISTQINNFGAIRLYSQMGGKIEKTYYWLYRGSHDII
ncbi:MAG: dTDP-4-amino-4,6-dideoxy-D-galactose acyltransferase [Arsenophonus sp.]